MFDAQIKEKITLKYVPPNSIARRQKEKVRYAPGKHSFDTQVLLADVVLYRIIHTCDSVRIFYMINSSWSRSSQHVQ